MSLLVINDNGKFRGPYKSYEELFIDFPIEIDDRGFVTYSPKFSAPIKTSHCYSLEEFSIWEIRVDAYKSWLLPRLQTIYGMSVFWGIPYQKNTLSLAQQMDLDEEYGEENKK